MTPTIDEPDDDLDDDLDDAVDGARQMGEALMYQISQQTGIAYLRGRLALLLFAAAAWVLPNQVVESFAQ